MSKKIREEQGASNYLLPANVVGKYGPSFSMRLKFQRVLFIILWGIAAKWTPPPLHNWRCAILRMFGASIGKDVRIYGSTNIWHPAFLCIANNSTIGPRVRLYNQGCISIGSGVVISQGAHICASSHNVSDPNFQLVLRPIVIGDDAWIAAEAFVGPGVKIGQGCVLGARGAAFQDLAPWTIHVGNPAQFIKCRKLHSRP